MEHAASRISIIKNLFSDSDKSIIASLPADISINYFIDEKPYSEYAEYKIKKLVAPSEFVPFIFRFSTEHFINFAFLEKFHIDVNSLPFIVQLEDFEIREIILDKIKYYITIDQTLQNDEGRRLICDYLISRYYTEDIDLVQKIFIIEEDIAIGHLTKINTEGQFLMCSINNLKLIEKIQSCVAIFRKLELFHSANVGYYDIDIRSAFLINNSDDVIFLNKKVLPNYFYEQHGIDNFTKRNFKYQKCIENYIRTLYLIFGDKINPMNFSNRVIYSEESFRFIENIVMTIDIEYSLRLECLMIFRTILVHKPTTIDYFDEAFKILHIFYRIFREMKADNEQFIYKAEEPQNENIKLMNEVEEKILVPSEEENKIEDKEESVEKCNKSDKEILDPESIEIQPIPEKIKPSRNNIEKNILKSEENTNFRNSDTTYKKEFYIEETKFTILGESIKKKIDPTKKQNENKTNYYEVNESVIINNPVFVNLGPKKFNERLVSETKEITDLTILSSVDNQNTNKLTIEQLQKLLELSNKLQDEAETDYNEDRFEQSKEKYELCLQYRIRCIGEFQKETGISMTALGGVYMKLGNYKEAIAIYIRAVAVFKQTLGEKHLLLSSVSHNIGLIYDLLNQYDDAMKYYNMALEIKITLLGEYNQSTATTYYNIGGIFDIRGDFVEALRIYKLSISIYNKVFGESNIDSATVYNNIGLVYDKQNKPEESIRSYVKSLELSTGLLGLTHPLVATSYNNMGLVYFKINQMQDAIDNFEKSIGIREKLSSLGYHNADTSSSYNNLAGIYYNLGQFPKAIYTYQKSLDADIKILGEITPETATANNNIGLAYVKLKDYTNALTYFQRSYDIRFKLFGEKDRDTVASLINIAGISFKMKENKTCVKYYSQALDAYKKIYGERNSELIRVYSNLGHSYNNLTEFEEAFNCYSNALEICLEKYGEKSYHTADSYANISNYYENVGDIVKMKEFLMKSVIIKENLNFEKIKDSRSYDVSNNTSF